MHTHSSDKCIQRTVRGELGTHSSRCSNSIIRYNCLLQSLKQRNANNHGYSYISDGRNEPSTVPQGFMGQMMSFPSVAASMLMSAVDAQRPGSVQSLASALASADSEHQHVVYSGPSFLQFYLLNCGNPRIPEL
ncbi:hypothetical protein MKW92_048110 [Papaver armeniacum]|nr:hypothetical protein MKW92_048110 [Papaver armeniacum]